MVPQAPLLCALACAAVLVAATDARAQGYPVKPIRMIVPFPPGGPIDVMGRITGDRLSQGVGQTVVIENRPGAGAVIGSKAVASAEPDGYTLLFGSSGSLAVTPALYKNAGYDPVKSFAPVAAVAEGPLVLAVHPPCRRRPSPSWSRTPRPMPASSTTAPGSARRRISPTDCSSS